MKIIRAIALTTTLSRLGLRRMRPHRSCMSPRLSKSTPPPTRSGRPWRASIARTPGIRPSPRTRSSRGPNDTVGAVRLLTLKDGGTIKEKLLAFEPKARKFRYAILEGVLPVSDYTSTLTVTSAGQGQVDRHLDGAFQAQGHERQPGRQRERQDRDRHHHERLSRRTRESEENAGRRDAVSRSREPHRHDHERPRLLSSRRCRVVHADLRCADPGAGRGVAGDPIGTGCAGGRSDGIGQDLRGFPRRHRSARQGGIGPGALPDETRDRLCLAAEGAVQRHSSESRGAARGHRRGARGAWAFPRWPIRAVVRTGDTPQIERARMRRTAPHIVVTTPESLYILLTSESGRAMLVDLPHRDRR